MRRHTKLARPRKEHQLAKSDDEAAVNAAVEALTKAMLQADGPALERLVSDQLSYGHSSGLVETKAQFVDVVANR